MFITSSNAAIKTTHGSILLFFAPQGWHIPPIIVKFGTSEETKNHLRRAKFHVDRSTCGHFWPTKFQKSRILQTYSPRRGESVIPGASRKCSPVKHELDVDCWWGLSTHWWAYVVMVLIARTHSVTLRGALANVGILLRECWASGMLEWRIWIYFLCNFAFSVLVSNVRVFCCKNII